MMFIQNDDFNFICYMALLILEKLSCTKENFSFIDYRKIAFIANIVFYKNKTDWDEIYYDSQITLKTLEMVIQSLEKKGIINIMLNDTRKTIDIWLADRTLSKMFVKEQLFTYELEEIEKIRKIDNRLRTSKLSTFLDKQFSSHGVKVWEV